MAVGQECSPVETHDLLSNGVVSRFQVAQHLGYDLLGVAAVTHGVEEVHCPLPHAHISLRLGERAGGGESRLSLD